MQKHNDESCPICGNHYLSKADMARKILEKIGFKSEQSQAYMGNFSVEEMRAIYQHVVVQHVK